MKSPLIRILAPVSVICGAFGLLSGCSSEPDSHLVSAPPPGTPVNTTVMTTTTSSAPVVVANPTYVTTTPVVVANPGYVTTTNGIQGTNMIVVTQAPPAPQQEVALAQPSPQHVWIRGYWTWRDNQYQWMSGHWELPPNSGSVWVAPRWEQEGNAYRFHEGYWS